MKQIMFVLVIVLLLTSCVSEETVKKEIKKANYCETKADCVSLGSMCPFGCYIYVNSAEEDRVRGLMDSYFKEQRLKGHECVYDCVRCMDVECVDSKCEPVCE